MKTSKMMITFAVITFTAAFFWGADQRELDACQTDLAQAKERRVQAEHIEYKLIREAADDWCGDYIDDMWKDIRQCEEKDVSKLNGCQECWDAWTFDMEGSCRSIMYDFEYKAEDTMLARSAQLLWQDYAEARHEDCRSRGLKTVEELHKCLGPADRPKEIQDALDAMFIHQQSRSITDGL